MKIILITLLCLASFSAYAQRDDRVIYYDRDAQSQNRSGQSETTRPAKKKLTAQQRKQIRQRIALESQKFNEVYQECYAGFKNEQIFAYADKNVKADKQITQYCKDGSPSKALKYFKNTVKKRDSDPKLAESIKCLNEKTRGLKYFNTKKPVRDSLIRREGEATEKGICRGRIF